MHLAIAVDVHGIKEVPYLCLVLEVRWEVLLHILKCNEAIIITIYLEKHFSESFGLFFIYFTAVCDDILNTLPE